MVYYWKAGIDIERKIGNDQRGRHFNGDGENEGWNSLPLTLFLCVCANRAWINLHTGWFSWNIQLVGEFSPVTKTGEPHWFLCGKTQKSWKKQTKSAYYNILASSSPLIFGSGPKTNWTSYQNSICSCLFLICHRNCFNVTGFTIIQSNSTIFILQGLFTINRKFSLSHVTFIDKPNLVCSGSSFTSP